MSEIETTTTITTASPGLTFEQKVQQVAAVVPKDDELTEEDEFDIIEGKGIKYVLTAIGKPDIELYVAPLKLSQYRLFYDIDKANRSGMPVNDVLDITAKALANIFKIDPAVIEDYLDREDIEKLSTLLGAGIYMGKGMFKKKRLSLSEAERILSNPPKQSRG
jgi:hypothetical protein